MISLDVTSLVKLIVALVLGLLAWLLVRQQQRLRAWLAPNQEFVMLTTFVVFRLVPFVLVYVVLGQEPRSDVEFFWVKAKAAYAGKLVYRDFLSYHAPLFGYIVSLPLFIWYNARVIILFMAVIEFVIARATVRRYRARQPDAIVKFVLYYVLPLSFVAMVLSSEEDIWMWGFGLITLGLAGRLSSRSFSFWAGIVWGIGMLTIKFMLVVLLVPLFFGMNYRARFLLGLLAVGVPSLLLLYGLMGTAFLMPIQHSEYAMAPNILSVARPWLFGLVGRTSLTPWNWLGLLVTIGWASVVAFQHRSLPYRRLFPLLYCFVFSVFMLALPSSPGYYLFTHLLAVCFVLLRLDDRRGWAELIVLNVLTVVQPIIWVVYADMKLYDNLYLLTRPIYLLDYVIQVVEVILLIRIVRLCLLRFRDARRGDARLADL